MKRDALRILTVNTGSSSIKIALYRMGREETLVLSGKIDRIGLDCAHFEVKDAAGKTLSKRELHLPDHNAGRLVLLDWMADHLRREDLDAVGHRLVHGGSRHQAPQLITPELEASLANLIPLAPQHLPQELKNIEAIRERYPALQQVACFDTAFHAAMPATATLYALPRSFREKGVMRYGFHGLSCEYLVAELGRQAGPEAANARLIIAHLGNGASMTAVRGGQSMDTTMGFTPAGGLVMSTRTGDVDPGVLVYLLEEEGLTAPALNELVNRKAGLLAVSGSSPDMKDLLDREDADTNAAAAVNLFCYQAKKFLGALAAAMGGLDIVIFSGGIGENAPPVRRRICEGLTFLGIHLHPRRNDENAPIISADGSPCTVRVMRTDEDRMIGRHTCRVLGSEHTGGAQ